RTFSLPVGCERIIMPPTRAGVRDNVARRLAREIVRDVAAPLPEISRAFWSHVATPPGELPILRYRHFETSFRNYQSPRLSRPALSRRRCSCMRSLPAQRSQTALATAME